MAESCFVCRKHGPPVNGTPCPNCGWSSAADPVRGADRQPEGVIAEMRDEARGRQSVPRDFVLAWADRLEAARSVPSEVEAVSKLSRAKGLAEALADPVMLPGKDQLEDVAGEVVDLIGAAIAALDAGRGGNRG